MTSPNIVWICTDQHRSDGLGCAGNPIARTPNIDALARAGTRFTRHITPCQMCMPSRSSMFTGLFPRTHQVIANGYALDDRVHTLPSLLADAGYRTHGAGKHHLQPLLAPADKRMPDSRVFWTGEASRHWTGPYYGLQTIDLLMGEADSADIAGHYARWLHEKHPEAAGLLHPSASALALPGDLDEVWPSAMPVELHYNTWVTERALDFLDSAEGPFFLFVSYPDPHHPFAPPKEYADRFDPRDMPLPRVEPGELDRMPSYYRNLFPTGSGFREIMWAASDEHEQGSMIPTDDISDATMRRAIAYTYAMIAMIDDNVGRLVDRILAQSREDDTIFVFTSDHGELLGTHGLLHKGPPPYRQLTEIPFIMKGPGVPSGREISALTNHVDLAPTLLEMCGVAANGFEFEGRSMSALFTSSDAGWRRYNFGEFHPRTAAVLYNQTVQTDRWRFTVYPKKAEWGELFDLTADPQEHNNLFADEDHQEVVRDLASVLAEQFPPQESVANQPLGKW